MKRSHVPNQKNLPGRPRKLSAHQERLLLRQIASLREEDWNLTVKRLMGRVGLKMRELFLWHCATVPSFKWLSLPEQQKERCVTKHRLQKTYKICESNKERLQKECLDGKKIAFYLDGVSFIHKYKPYDQARAPKGKIWRKTQEGVARGCTAKGAHCGSGGHLAKCFVKGSRTRQ